ncbi:MAG TPA: alpha/beta hydrolase [Candidatus Dormibacteraeota bacterium]|nr:alpha/beta hydrolase [Methylomirabilota bacterium]HWN04165.1 alpha/beta hydrolase [Candidatus Dormibacteraeota bacterium]
MDDPRGVSRRALLLSAGVGLGAVTVDGARKPLLAQADRPRADELWSAEYVARKGDVSLALYRKRIGPPQAGERPVLFLVHGSSVSAKPSFDLTVPGRGEYSLMNVFAGYGFDVWTMDHEGYGKSARTAGNSDVASGVEDLKAASEVVVRETGQPRAHFYGGSSGALRAAGFAMARPERVDRLILEAFTWTGKGSPTLGKRAEQVDYYRTHNRRPRGRDMIRSIFTRDKPGTSDPAVAEALADAELPFGDTIPTGTYLDMTANLPVVDPRRVKAPVLMVRGEHDGIATEDDLLDFFRRLPNPDRQFIVLAGASHAVALGLSRGQLWHVVRAFLTLPTA